jgi:hypothetical protein
MPITFDVSDVQYKGDKIKETYIDLEYKDYFITHNSLPITYVKTDDGHGFIKSAIISYIKKIELEISPDEVWCTILSTFVQYLRSKDISLANLPDVISVNTPSEIANIHTINMSRFLYDVTCKLHDIVDPDIIDWFECNFSTTTEKEKLISRLLVIANPKEPVESVKGEHELNNFVNDSGQPRITLNGDIDDWKKLIEKIKKIQEFNDPKLTTWSKCLCMLVQIFINTFEEKLDRNVWKKFISYSSFDKDNIFNGWINRFIQINNYIEKDKKVSGIMNVPMQITSNSTTYDIDLEIGFIRAHVNFINYGIQDKSPASIKSELDWIMIKK